jgi:hypothetical protein
MSNSENLLSCRKNTAELCRRVWLVVSILLLCGLAGYSIFSFQQSKDLQQKVQNLQKTFMEAQEETKKDIEALKASNEKDLAALKDTQAKDFKFLTADQEKDFEDLKAGQEKDLESIKDSQEKILNQAKEIDDLSSQLRSIKKFIVDEFSNTEYSFSGPQPYSYFLGDDWKSEVADIINRSQAAGVVHTRVIANGEDNTFVVAGAGDFIIDGVWLSGIDTYKIANNQKKPVVILEPGLVQIPHDKLTIIGEKDKDTVLLDGCLTWKKAGHDKSFMVWKAVDAKGAAKTVRITSGINVRVQDKCNSLYLRRYQLEVGLAPLKGNNSALRNSPAVWNASFGGLGLAFGNDSDITAGMKIINVFPGKPGDRAGLKAGDTIVKINSQPVSSMSKEEAIMKMRGPVGLPITLTYISAGMAADETKEVTLSRELINVPRNPTIMQPPGPNSFWLAPGSNN